jgi:hypothetical protein
VGDASRIVFGNKSQMKKKVEDGATASSFVAKVRDKIFAHFQVVTTSQ